MKTKKNSSGFTMVELIVATAILGILMVGAFSFMRPAKQNYTDAGKFSDLNGATSAICDYLTEYLRYSDAILILENYDGVPVTSGKKIGGKDFTDYFVIDTSTVFANPETAAFRKGCTGRILRAALGLSGVDLSTANVIMGDSIFGAYFYTYDVSAVDDSVSIDITAFYPIRDSSGVYVPDPNDKFTTNVTVESMNLKISADSVIHFDFAASPNYSAYPQVAASSGTTYTYIFYNIPS